MKAIWKYEISPALQTEVSLPRGAEWLHVAVQNGKPYVWALADDDEPLTEVRALLLFQTGERFDTPPDADYIGSFHVPDALINGEFVGHVWGSR